MGTSDLGLTNQYVANSLSGQTIVVGNNVVLALPNGLSMSGNDTITIMPAANVVGMPFNFPPGAGVLVYSGLVFDFDRWKWRYQPARLCCRFYCLLCPNGHFIFVERQRRVHPLAVAPTVDLTLNGGGNNVIDFIGCAMVNSATLNGHFHFHYDQCLANLKNNPRFLITAGNEVP